MPSSFPLYYEEALFPAFLYYKGKRAQKALFSFIALLTKYLFGLLHALDNRNRERAVLLAAAAADAIARMAAERFIMGAHGVRHRLLRGGEIQILVDGGDIQALRDEGCDIVIVSYHWGAEKDYYPNDNQVRLGRATIDAGADLVVGHHSHRINPIEYYNGKYICYSLGNFSFAGNNKPSDMTTFLFQIRMRLRDGEATGEAIKIIPCRISSRTDYNDFAPTPYTDDSSIEVVLRTLRENGKRLDYAVEEYPLKWPDEE